MAGCWRCGGTFSESQLLFHTTGRLCMSCEAIVEQEEHDAKERWMLAVSGPLLGVFALMLAFASFLPLIGLLFSAFGVGVGVLGVTQSGRALALAKEPDKNALIGAVVGFLLCVPALLFCLVLICKRLASAFA